MGAGHAGDGGMDLRGDQSSDLPLLEVAPDHSVDLPLAPPDVAPDTETDTPPDVPTDMEIDTPPDVATDMDMETSPDVATGGDGSSPDTPGGDGKAPWSPGVIPNLVLWLEGDRGIDATPGAKVSEWRDQSPLHNDAKQTTDMFAPKLAGGPGSGAPGLAVSS